MNGLPQPGSGRPRDLTRTKVIEAGLDLLDREGAETITMRSLAQSLKVTPMALYNHVRSKDDLMRAMAAHVLDNAEFDGQASDWRSQLIHCARAFRAICLRHPGLARLLEVADIAPATAFTPMEVVVQALTRAGMSRIAALQTYFTLVGFIFVQASYQSRGPFRNLEPAGLQQEWDFEAAFEFGLGLVLDGVETAICKSPAKTLTAGEEQAQIVLIDPKAGVDYFAFEDLPHLDGAIIDNENQALERLDALVTEMQRRYALFKEARVSNITAYNKARAEPLPLIWLIHDEFADWMQLDSYRAGVEAAVTRLGVKARAAGIYLIFAAQRPDASVFPMQLRSNLGNRLILRVDSVGTSDLSLGIKNGGAERLLGKGHLAAIIGGGTNATYAQVPFLSTERLEQLVVAIVRDLAQTPV